MTSPGGAITVTARSSATWSGAGQSSCFRIGSQQRRKPGSGVSPLFTQSPVTVAGATEIRFEIEREHYRQHFQPARIDALRGALASIGG